MNNSGETIILKEKKNFRAKESNFNSDTSHKEINLKNNKNFISYSTKKRRYNIFIINYFSLTPLLFFIIILSLWKIYKEHYNRYGKFKSIINPEAANYFIHIPNKKQNKTVYFTDIYGKNHLIFLEVLKHKYNIIYTDKNPDYLFYSTNGENHHNTKFKNSIKIFHTSFYFLPDFNECDYAIASGYLNYEDRYMRFPFYLRIDASNNVKNERKYIPGKKFCAWVVSNKNFKLRNKFFDELSKYKKVDSGGRFRNNVGGAVKNKIAFLRGYKFSIQFENCGTPGYTTEKIFEGFIADTIPIYYGDETIVDIINPNSFILVKNEADFKNAIKLIKKIDNDEELYKKILKEPVYKNNLNEFRFLKEEDKIRNFLYYIFDQDLNKAKRRYIIK